MDRLSELPDFVIFHIFWLLPIRDVVRTTILSKHWKNLWSITPFLNIDHYIMDFDARKHFPIIVHRALLRWDGVKVLKFKVKLDRAREVHGDADLWLRFAKKHEVEELYLLWENFDIPMSGDDDHKAIWVPQYLYSCSSLKVLSIKNCYFRINGNVQWNHLKSLTIRRGYGVTDEVINQILCGSPQLEVLNASYIERGQSLSIRSTSLKELLIYRHGADDASIYTTELRICTPNLKALEIKGIPFSKCLLMDVSSLSHATLGNYDPHLRDETKCDEPKCENFSGIDDFLTSSHFLGDLFGQILPSIQHVKNVKLLPCCVKVLGAMTEWVNSSSPNVKFLQFRFHCSKFASIVEISPLLKKLVIKVGLIPMDFFDEQYDEEDSLWANATDVYLKLKKYLPMSFILQLRIIEVTLVEGDAIFPFLEFLLKNAVALEKIVFRVKEIKRPSLPLDFLLRASHILLKMPRASRTAQFIFCEY